MSKILDYFGSPNQLRQVMRTDIIEHLRQDESPPDSKWFFFSRSGPTNEAIRSARTKGKRREHIYNYERDRFSHLWYEHIFCYIDMNRCPLAKYENGAKVLTINTNHHPILVKVLQSLMMDTWPQVTLILEPGDRPNYNYEAAADEPSRWMSRMSPISFTYDTAYDVPRIQVDEMQAAAQARATRILRNAVQWEYQDNNVIRMMTTNENENE